MDAGTSISSAGLGVPGVSCFLRSSQSGLRSAVVTYPVAFTNLANCPLVTSVASIQKPSTRTRCGGRSAGQASAASQPMVNSPPGTQTIPGGPSEPAAQVP